MRKVAIAVLTFAALTLLTGSGTNPSIYYRSQAEADADLARYDLDNPSCQLWTNWQKMCSRVGAEGIRRCTRDPRHAVRPSKPFCAVRLVAEPGEPILVEPELPETLTESRASSTSRRRFCATLWNGERRLVPFKPEVVDAHRSVPLCIAYKVPRPFDGLDWQSQNHPNCKEWQKEGGGLYRCSQPVKDENCYFSGNGVPELRSSSNGIYTGRALSSELRPIWGPFCIEKVKPNGDS